MNSLFQLHFCRVLIYILTTICLTTSVLVVINHFTHHNDEYEKHLQATGFHYHDLNQEEYQTLYKQAQSIIEKHRGSVAYDIRMKDSISAAGGKTGRTIPTLPQPGNVDRTIKDTGAGPYPSTTRDLVLGMAEDIDPKNLVS
jgi:hypothetical protein